jgi:aminopeptidase N
MTNDIYPSNYKIRLTLALDQTNFQGICTIELDSSKPIDKIKLNYDQLVISKCLLKKRDIEEVCSFTEYPQNQELIVDLPERTEGIFDLIIEFVGNFSEDLHGIYRSKYEYDGKEKYVISTQFEESNARRAFPCFDHPSKKATFDIEYIIDEGLVAISNTAILEEKKLENSKKLVRFKQTPKMCTYLLYFGVGEFEMLQDNFNGYLVRVLTTPGKAEYGKFAMDIAGKSLKFCEEYTDIKYPLSKCDLIGVPDFPYGAMENYGAIAFRETVFLLYPGITSTFMKLAIASVTAHEVSHFWFGDLVSPLEWRDIWLNESFASYFTSMIPDHYYPEWNMSNISLPRYYMGALERDGLIETYPVELPSEETDFISPAKVEIVYNKGASILRMLHGYLGEDAFKEAIKHFLAKYQFSCANTQHYWKAFEEATGKPIKKFADSWVHQPGYPIIYVKKENDEIILTQERFIYVPNKSDLKWFIPVKITFFLKNNEIKELDVNFEEKTYKILIPKETDSFKLNIRQSGFYRVKYEEDMIRKLGKLVLEKELEPIDRFGIENDYYALVKRGDYTINQYLELINNYYLDEGSFLPLSCILTHLKHAYLIFKSKRKEIKETGLRLLKNYIRKYGLEPIDGENVDQAIIRNSILWAAFSYGNQSAEEFGQTNFIKILEGKKVHQDILSSVLKIGAATNKKSASYFMQKLLAPDTPDVEKLYILEAFGCQQNKKDILKTLNMNLKQVPSQSRHYLFSSMAGNPEALELVWPWFLKNFKKIEEQSPMVYARTIASLIPMGGLENISEVSQFFKEYLNEKDLAKDTIKMTLELLEINSKMRER